MRKVIQITTANGPPESPTRNITFLTALCDDGTIWRRIISSDEDWYQCKGVPQPAQVKKKPAMVNLNG